VALCYIINGGSRPHFLVLNQGDKTESFPFLIKLKAQGNVEHLSLSSQRPVHALRFKVSYSDYLAFVNLYSGTPDPLPFAGIRDCVRNGVVDALEGFEDGQVVAHVVFVNSAVLFMAHSLSSGVCLVIMRSAT
jgi:hypothetical protein